MSQFVIAITPEIENHLESLHQEKGLTLVRPEDEGSPLASLPDNTYGYTSSPLGPMTPLFVRRIFQCFEVQKLSGGVVHLLGFVTEKEAKLVFESTQAMDFNLYPEPRGESARLVEIPLERIARAKALSRSEGNYMPIHLDPA
jgi:hypothetical protein